MKPLFETLFLVFYRFLVMPLAITLTLIGALFSRGKLRRWVKLRMPMDGKSPWAYLPRGKRPIWFHCSSGEFEYAKPVIRRLKQQHPHIPVLVTYFSPSFQSVVENFAEVDVCCPLPWDLPGPITSFLKHHEPRALLIARTDLWPELLFQTKRHQVPMLLFSATTRSPGLLKSLAKPLLRWMYNQLTSIYCVSTEDQDHLKKFTIDTPLSVVGDTRFDQVFDRLSQPKPFNVQLLHPESKTPRMVAGSTWPEDEKVLLPALAPLINNGQLDLILAPHEPSQVHLEKLLKALTKHNLKASLYSTATSWPSGHVLVVDQVGILAELYGLGQLAFVGGSFKNKVHSVMEPLAAGAVCLVGPLNQNNREAQEFKKLPLPGTEHTAMVNEVADAASLEEWTQKLIQQGLTTDSKAAIQSEAQKRRGASQKVLEWLTPYL